MGPGTRFDVISFVVLLLVPLVPLSLSGATGGSGLSQDPHSSSVSKNIASVRCQMINFNSDDEMPYK